MFNKFIKWLRNSTELEKAIVISIVIGIGITAVLIVETKEERFSSLYIYPESYTNYPEGNTTSFIYGVKSYERERTGYDLEVFVGDRLVDKKQFELNPGETREEKEILAIPDAKLPVKVRLVLKSPFNAYDAHYWLKRVEETPVPVKTPLVTPTPTLTPTPSPTPGPAYAPTYAPVLIDTMKGFSPKEVSIRIGDSVRWVNNDRNNRKFTLVSSEGLFTKVIDVDKRFEYKFNTSGTYTFYLKEFPDVKGVVIVS